MITRDTAILDLAVPGGDPASIRAAARRLRQVADTGLATAGVRGEAGGELAGVWTGPSATSAGPTRHRRAAPRPRSYRPHPRRRPVLHSAATLCARTLDGLTPSVSAASPIPAAPTLDPSLVDDLPLVRGQLDAAAAGVEHPEDLAQMALGTGMMVLGAGGKVGGVALDATGVGMVAGVPLNIAAASAIVTGAAAVGTGASRFIDRTRANDNRLLQEATGPTEPATRPPASNWTSSRPHPSPIEGARAVTGKMPKTAGPNEVLVRCGEDGEVNVYEIHDSHGLPVKRVNVRSDFRGPIPTPHVVDYIR